MGYFKNKKILMGLWLCFFLFWSCPALAATYTIHCASFKTIDQAELYAKNLQEQGYAAFVSEADISGSGKWHRVYSGKYSTRKKAEAAGAAMKQKQHIDKILIHSLPQAKDDFVSAGVAGGASADPSPGVDRSKRVKAASTKKRQPLKETAKTKQSGQKEVLRPDSELKKSDNRDEKLTEEKKEAFKALLMGDNKLMPPPPDLLISGISPDNVFTEPDEKNIIEPRSDSTLYNKALGELREKKYEQSLATFKEFISRDDTNKEWGQRALRHMADSHYWLGKQGSKEELLLAAEFYKNTLKSFPDPRKENALTYYRLAKTYEELKYYPEAVKQYQNLIAKYPDAPYAPEAYYKTGEILYTDGKYSEAAEALIRYQMKYPKAPNAKLSYYLIAYSFYKAKQSTNAEVWFREAQKKWPGFSNLPKILVIDYGLHKMSMRRYDEAVAAFSFYVNVYPDDEKIKEVSLLLGQAYRAAGQVAPALALYNRMIEKYPGSKEAAESMLAMALLGIDFPGVRVFRFLSNINNYRIPMETYDLLIRENTEGDIAELARLDKAAALVKKGQGRTAADVYLDFIRQYPESKRLAQAARGLKSASDALIDEYYNKQDYLAVAYVYFRSYGAVALQAEEYPQVNKIAQSLKNLGLMSDYLKILTRYLKVATDESIINKVTLDITDGLIAQGQLDEAQKKLAQLAAKPAVKKSTLMTGIQKNLGEIAYRQKEYGQAVINYDAVVRSGQTLDNPGLLYSRYARSLKEKNENAQALQNYLTAVQYLNEGKNQKIITGIAYKEMGDLYLMKDQPGTGLSMYNKAVLASTDQELKLWSQFLVGETYLKLNDNDQAQNTFAQIKATAGPEGFWTNVVDFYLADFQWWEKYGNMIKDKQ